MFTVLASLSLSQAPLFSLALTSLTTLPPPPPPHFPLPIIFLFCLPSSSLFLILILFYMCCLLISRTPRTDDGYYTCVLYTYGREILACDTRATGSVCSVERGCGSEFQFQWGISGISIFHRVRLNRTLRGGKQRQMNC